MANEKNLVQNRSRAEAEELSRKGGINSGASRRKKRDMRVSMQEILATPLTEQQQKQVEQLGLPDANWTLADLVNIIAVQRAFQGNVRAMEYVRDTAGYDPELQLKESQFEFEKEKRSGQGTEIEDLSGVITNLFGYDAWMRLLNDGIPVILTREMDYQFSQAHMDYIRNCQDNMYNVLEGAIRSGKTVDNILAFAISLCQSEDKFHLATGSTMANAKMNIGIANGFGLENIFRGQCRWGSYKDNDSLIIRGPYTNFEEKVVVFAGGESSVSYKKIRGNSYGMWIATEINLHHDNTIKEAFNRTAASKLRRFFWDLNPCHPKDPIYGQYIDSYAEKAKQGTLKGGYNYAHFTIFDNISIPKSRLDEIVSQYDEESIWYKRDILGKRSIAEGLIYGRLANSIAIKDKKYCIKKEEAQALTASRGVLGINVGVDFGGNGSGHAFVATAKTLGHDKLIVLRSERYLDNQLDPYSEEENPRRLSVIDPELLGQLFLRFIRKIIKDYGYVSKVYADSAEQVLIKGFRADMIASGLGEIKVVNAMKTKINDRIFATTMLVAQDRFSYVDGDCESFENAVSMAVWNPKVIELERLDDGTSDIDTMDAFEYTFERDIKKLINKPAGR